MASRCEFVFFLVVVVLAFGEVSLSCPVDADLPCRCSTPETLDCSNSNLTAVPANISSVNMTIRQLNLQHNMIRILADDAFQGLYQLTEINLSHNEIEDIGASFSTLLPHLQSLQLNDNQIASIGQEQFKMLSALVSLDLKNNSLKTLKVGAFNGLTNLTTLNLDSNQINTIESGAFKDLGNLKTLFLGNNNLSDLSENQLVGLNSLVNLSLENNKLETLPGRISTFTSIMMINVENNPLNCDTKMAWIPDWRKDHNIQGTCAEPQQLRSKTLAGVSEIELSGHTGQLEGNVTVNMTLTTTEPTNPMDTPEGGVEMWIIVVIVIVVAVVFVSVIACIVLALKKRRMEKAKPDHSKQTRIFYNHKYDSVKQSGQRSKDIYADLTTEL